MLVGEAAVEVCVCVCDIRTYSVVDSSRVSTFIVSILLVVYGSFRQVFVTGK